MIRIIIKIKNYGMCGMKTHRGELTMRDYIITTDNMADLPDDYIAENGLGIMSLTYMIDGETYDKEHELPYKEFYDKMRQGSMPTTSQVNPAIAKSEFMEFIRKDLDILHIAFSSGLSGSYSSCCIAAEEIVEEYPDRKVIVIDSLAASMGEGLLVHRAVSLKQQGKSLAEVAAWAEENKLHIGHNFTVDDLFHLYRGGRVSKTTAILGSMVNIKPVLVVDNDGHLIPVGKVRGRKKSLVSLVDNMEKKMGSYKNQNDMIMISHGDCLEDAQYVQKLIQERFGFENFMINRVGPTIGAHSGPGTVALFFMADNR